MTEPCSKKKRGAPPGNKNAYKHGFYARQYQPVDNQDLENMPSFSLTDEIDLLRVNIRRLLENSQSVSSFSDTLNLVRTLTLAATCLTRLMRTHNDVRHLNHDHRHRKSIFQDDFSQSLQELERALAEKTSGKG